MPSLLDRCVAGWDGGESHSLCLHPTCYCRVKVKGVNNIRLKLPSADVKWEVGSKATYFMRKTVRYLLLAYC